MQSNSSLGMQCESVEEFARGTDSKSANLSQIPQSSHSHTANTRIVGGGEIQDSKEVSESSLSESHNTSESTASDSHSSSESTPHTNLESAKDSKLTPAVGQRSTAIESNFSSKRCSEQALKASPFSSGNLTNGLQGGGSDIA